MPAKPLTVEEIKLKYGESWHVPSIPLVDGYLHMHYRHVGQTWCWCPVQRTTHGICGTERCVILKVTRSIDITGCEHTVRAPEFGEMICTKCGDVIKYDIKVSRTN